MLCLLSVSFPSPPTIGQCRAIAAAVMGDNYQVEFLQFPLSQRAQVVSSREVDVLFSVLSRAMDREVYIPAMDNRLAFSAPYSFYTVGFGGDPKYLACAENGLRQIDECDGIRICVQNATRQWGIIRTELPAYKIINITHNTEAYDKFYHGQCNVVLGSSWVEITERLRNANYIGEFEAGKAIFTVEPFAAATIAEDQQWADFVNWVLHSLIAAEHYGITQDNVDEAYYGNQTSLANLVQTYVFGEDYKDMFYHAVKTSGNWGELVDRRLNPVTWPRRTVNHLVNGTHAGIMYSLPFGQVDTNGPNPKAGGTLAMVAQQGKLRCGVIVSPSSHPAFAAQVVVNNVTGIISYQGMDIDYCRAVAASIMGTADGRVEYVEVGSDKEGFLSLNRGDIDLLAGVPINLENDVREPTTGVGFAFTKPYFYNNTAVEDFSRYVNAMQ